MFLLHAGHARRCFRVLGATRLTGREGEKAAWLLAVAQLYARKAGISPPAIAVFEGHPLVLSAGISRNNATLFVSLDLVRHLGHAELRAALAYNISRIANGDMVTLSLLQGLFASHVLLIPAALNWLWTGFSKHANPRNRGIHRKRGPVTLVLFVLFGLFLYPVMCAVSRKSVLTADRFAADLLGSKEPLQALLQILTRYAETSGVALMAGRPCRFWLWDTHPTPADRLGRLLADGR